MSRWASELSERFFAWASSHRNSAYERWMEKRKLALFHAVRGTVAEIGAGTGANFPYLSTGIRYIAVEPNRFMHPYLMAEAARLGREIAILDCRSEAIALADCSVDAVVGTLVLCSVVNPGKAMEEIGRVLKPGGKYYFIEHVAAPNRSMLRRIQRTLRPCWGVVSNGCHPDRETLGTIRASGLEIVELDSFRVGAPVVSPHIAGCAVKL